MSSDHLVRVTSDLIQLKGALILLAGNNAYFITEAWLEPLKAILGKEMSFRTLAKHLRDAQANAKNPQFKRVDADVWAKRISQQIGPA